MKSGKGKEVTFMVFFLLMTCFVCFLCLYHLQESGTHNWDEARHVINAYEMMETGNPWIHTYMYETDYYNFKPPLSMWCIMLCFKLFGATHYSMRLSSAIATICLFIVSSVFIRREFGKIAAGIYGIVFTFNLDMFFFHMARSADADALYLLMFTLAMLCLYKAKDQPWFLVGTTFFLSEAFMAKCLHAALGIAITVCFLPAIYKKCKVKHYVAALTAGIIPTGIWALVRFRYDGLTFFAGMMGQEVVDRIEKESDYMGYFRYIVTKPAILLLLIITLVASLFMWKINSKKQRNGQHEKIILRIVSDKLYLFVLWTVIPLAVYSASGAFMQWYSYIIFFPLYIIFSIILGGLIREKRSAVVLAIALVVIFGVNVKDAVTHLKILKYENNVDIRNDLFALIESYPEYEGCSIYIENIDNEYQPQNMWEQNCVVDAYLAGNMKTRSGGGTSISGGRGQHFNYFKGIV